MPKKIIKNMAASSRAHLNKIAADTGADFDALSLQYFQERLLYRLSVSKFYESRKTA